MPPPNRPRPPRALRGLGWLGVLAWAAAIFILSSMPPAELQKIEPFRLWDKAAHFIAFAVGAANLALVLRWSTTWRSAGVGLVAVIAIMLFAASDEIHQLFTPGRSGGDPGDWLADTLGAGAGAWIILTLYARLTRTRLAAPARA